LLNRCQGFNPYADLEKAYRAALTLHELALLHEFFAIANINAKEWHEIKESYLSDVNERERQLANEAIKTNPQQLNNAILARIQALLAEHGINPHSIMVVVDNKGDSDLCR